MQLPDEPAVVEVDLANNQITVDVELTNPGDSATEEQPLSVSDPSFNVAGIETGAAGPALQRGAAVRFAPEPSCAESQCQLPSIPAHSSVPATITLTLTSEAQLQDFPHLTVMIGDVDLPVPVNLDAEVELIVETPSTERPGAATLRAGNTSASEVRVTFPQGTNVTSIGSISLPAAADDVLFDSSRDSASCERSDSTLSCDLTPGDDGSFAADLTATALPNADKAVTLVPVIGGWETKPVDVAVQPRTVGDPIDMTGPFRVATVGESTSHCLSLLSCHYHAHPRDLIAAPGTVVSAELTWIADTETPTVPELASPTRDVRFGTNTQQITGIELGNHVFAANVTDEVAGALTPPLSGLPVTMPPTTTEIGLGIHDRTGWTLTVVWQADGVDTNRQIEIHQPAEPTGAVQQYELAGPGDPVDSASVLALWDPMSAINLENGYAGVWCRYPQDGSGVGPLDRTCSLTGWPALRSREDGSLFLDLNPYDLPLDVPIDIILGPAVVERELPPA